MKDRIVTATIEMRNGIPKKELREHIERALDQYRDGNGTAIGRTQRVKVDPAPRGQG